MKTRSFLVILLLASLVILGSCRGSRATRMQRKAEKMEVQAARDNEKIVEEFHKHHYEIQADQTQKMMKDTKKRNKKLKRQKRGSFIDRMFRRKRTKNCYGN